MSIQYPEKSSLPKQYTVYIINNEQTITSRVTGIMRSSLSTEDPLHYSVASQDSSDESQSLHFKERPTTTRSRGTLCLSTPTLQRSLTPSRNLTLNEQEHATRKWACLDPGRLFHVVEERRLLWQAHDDDGDPENTNARRIAPERQSKTLQPSLRSSAKAAVVEPLRLSAKVAVDMIAAFPFRHNKSSREDASTTTGGPITTRTFLNPFRWRQQREEDDAPIEPFATRNNNPSIRNLVGTALPTISRQSWWDFIAMLLSYFTGWFANGIVIIGCLVVSSTADWWSQVLRVFSWPQQIAAKWIWLIQWVRNEIRNVMEGTGHQKYVYMAGAGVAIHKASNIKMPRLTRRPKRHSTKNEDW